MPETQFFTNRLLKTSPCHVQDIVWPLSFLAFVTATMTTLWLKNLATYSTLTLERFWEMHKCWETSNGKETDFIYRVVERWWADS